MTQAIGLREGQQIIHPVGHVTVVLTCIRPGHAYRAAVHHTGTTGQLGAEIPELSQSWPTETEARAAATRATIAFRWAPTNVPFAAQVEYALASIATQLDEAIDRAMRGSDGTGRHTIGLSRLTAARQALKTEAEKAAEAALVARLTADLERYNTTGEW